jgi:anti-sigma factor RsiW
MANADQIRDLITETTTGCLRPRVPREVAARYAAMPAAAARREPIGRRSPARLASMFASSSDGTPEPAELPRVSRQQHSDRLVT